MEPGRFQWSLLVLIPGGIIALAFMAFTLRLLKPEHVLMMVTMISDVVVLTMGLQIALTFFLEPAKRYAIIHFTSSKKSKIITGILVLFLVVSCCMHLFGGVGALNSQEYIYIALIPLLLVLLTRFF